MKMTRNFAKLVKAGALALAVAFAGFGPAMAIDSGNDEKPVVCKTGYVWSKAKQVCVKVSSGLLDDKQLYEEGRKLAKAGHYALALAALEAVEDQNDSMVLTMIGYSKRKMGNWNEGVAYYHKALAINPNNLNTREYLGEAYLTKGRVDLAKAELAKIEAIAGTESEQYQELALAIAGGSGW
jgi:tetratricopeptide (TPR) repeat protein